jgi:hypothetical protein
MRTKAPARTSKLLPTTNYSQQLLQQWQPLKALIWQHGASLAQREQGQPIIMHDDITRTAINSPYYHFFTNALAAASKTERLRIALLQQKNESISDAASQGMDTAAQQKIPDDLAEQISITSLETSQKQLFEKIYLQHDAWQNNLSRWAEATINILVNSGFEFTPEEVADFQVEERYHDLEARAAELAIEFKKAAEPTFADYYQLKSRILLQGALSRRQKPHTSDILDSALTCCSEHFTQIKHDEIELNNIQQHEIVDELGILNFETQKSQ